MAILASLRSRVFAATAAVAVLPVLTVSLIATSRLTREAEDEIARGLDEAARIVVRFHESEREILRERALLVADLPRLKAAVAEGDAPTVEPVARDYRERVKADALVVIGGRGPRLAGLGLSSASALAAAGRGALFVVDGERLVELVTVPILAGGDPAEELGRLTLGLSFDERTVARIHDLTGSDVALVFGGRVLASTLPRTSDTTLLGVSESVGTALVVAAEGDYTAVARPLGGASGPVALLLRSRREALRPVRTVRAALLLAGSLAVIVSVFLSYAVARTVTRPLAALTSGMKAVAATGDLTKKIGPGGRWDDEDARLVARTFDALTLSIARFQREAGLRERLSALGRLSTVVAHEVRNPLMIIKGTLRTLRRGANSAEEVREAAAEIDNEVVRLDRIVGDVLDFARPLEVDLASTDLGAVCRDAVRGVPEAGLDLDSTVRSVQTDGERLRGVLVNLVENARDSLAERATPQADGDAAGPRILVGLRGTATGAAIVFVQDRGAGIAKRDLPEIFEPYFTTKRKGTGLGLAIARKTIESLGGTIRVESRLGEGTRVEIELPGRPRGEALDEVSP